mgnify:CR=1 FL=1|jgi:hypothetical protein|tara:strand:- start:507 stop:770 length:264 start_codon:yes stop_codon:yes gene_type:complete
MVEKYDLEFWEKVKIVRDLNLKLENIKKEDKKKQEDSRKIIKMVLITLNNRDMLEGGRVLYNKNALLRFGMNIFFKYIVKTFKKYHI